MPYPERVSPVLFICNSGIPIPCILARLEETTKALLEHIARKVKEDYDNRSDIKPTSNNAQSSDQRSDDSTDFQTSISWIRVITMLAEGGYCKGTIQTS